MKLRMQTRNRDLLFSLIVIYFELAVWWFWYCLLEGESFARPDLHWRLQRPWRHWTFWRTSSSFLVQVIIIFGTSDYHLWGQVIIIFEDKNVDDHLSGSWTFKVTTGVFRQSTSSTRSLMPLSSQSFCAIIRWQQRKEMINPIRSCRLRSPP